MALTTTITRLPYATGDNNLPIFCRDPAAAAKGTTDFVMDWIDPYTWGGVTPAAGQPQPVRNFPNLALDASTVLGRQTGVTTFNNGGINQVNSRGAGLAAANVDGSAFYNFQRVGEAWQDFASPVKEGFKSFYLDTWFRQREEADFFSRGIIGRGSGASIEYGLGFDQTNGNIVEWTTGRILGQRVLNGLVHLGLALTFDTAADTTMIRTFRDGDEIGAAFAGTKPSQWSDTAGGVGVFGLAGWGRPSMDVARVSRTFTRFAGQGVLDPLNLHKAEERGRSRL